MTFADNEPLITASGVTALVAALIALLVAFGVPVTDQQREAILSLVAILAPLAVALLARAHVTPTVKADAQVAQALANAVVAPPAPVAPPASPAT